MTDRLAEALRRVALLPGERQDSIASTMMDALDDEPTVDGGRTGAIRKALALKGSLSAADAADLSAYTQRLRAD